MTAPGSTLDQVITYFRRYVKEGDQVTLPDDTCIDYINRFYIYKMPSRLQLFDLQRQYYFDTTPNINYYLFPKTLYQKISSPVYVDGIEINYYQNNAEFYRAYPEQVFNEQPLVGDGTASYTHTLTNIPIMRSFFDKPAPTDTGFDRYKIPNLIISAVDENGATQYIVDDGNGLLVQTDNQLQNIVNSNIGWTVNYITGSLVFVFPSNIPSTNSISIQSIPYQANRPVAALFTDNYIKTVPVPDKQYRMTFQIDLTPAQFLNTENADDPSSTDIASSGQELPFAYMSNYIALGAARMFMWEMRKEDSLRFYERYFREEENEVLRRSSRQKDPQRTKTIFSSQTGNYFNNYYNQY